jgi:hypothetical protein
MARDLQSAKRHLRIAKKHLERAQATSDAPSGPEECVTWSFYAFENAVSAAADAAGIRWDRNHPSKQRAAKLLHKRGIVSFDISDRLEELNALRKDIQYGEPGEDLQQVPSEDLVGELESFIDEVERYVASKEK